MPLNVAEIVTFVVAETALVVTGKVALVAPSATVTDAGTLTDGSLLDKETTAPPVGAGPFNATVPVDELPPVKSTRLSVTEESATLRLKNTFWLREV